MPNAKQNHAVRLHPVDSREEERRLTASFLRIVAALPERPAPRHVWDNVASPNRLPYRGKFAVEAAQSAMRAALDTGRSGIIEDTAAAIALFFDDCKGAALRAYHAHVNGHISIEHYRVKASKEGHEAMHAIAVLADSNRELTLMELDEAILALSDLRAGLIEKTERPLNRRPALALS